MSLESGSFEYHFQNVGQGLFSSGKLVLPNTREPRIVWVYDCGTSSSPSLVVEGLKELAVFRGGRMKVDLATISHFDHDHISGIVELISAHHVDVLLLPYVPLWKRLTIAIDEGIAAAESLMSFFFDPVIYLDQFSRSKEIRYVFVLPSQEGPPVPRQRPGEEGGPRGIESTDRNPGEQNKAEERLEIPKSKKSPEHLGGPKASKRVLFLREGSAIPIKDIWEFVPYNDDTEVDVDQAFKDAVEKKRDALTKRGAKSKTREAALNDLKKLFDTKFGDDAEDRNVISLHLYAGQTLPVWSSTLSMDAGFNHQSAGIPHGYIHTTCTSILYTGDAYLRDSDTLTRLVSYLKDERVAHVGVFQVMHHGAEKNWHQGIAECIAPHYSIFSSDPNRKKWLHPHAPVVRDFLPYGPIQVDKYRKATIHSDLSYFPVPIPFKFGTRKRDSSA